MPTTLQLFMTAGALLMGGLALLLGRLAPTSPDLADALDRLSPKTRAEEAGSPYAAVAGTSTERVGLLAMRHLPEFLWARTPHKELALLRRPVAVFYGQKVVYALAALVIVPTLAWMFSWSLQIPVVVPVLGALVAAGVLWFVPNYDVHAEAKAARADFQRALVSYVDLVALERNAGAGPRQAMENAAQEGSSWVFLRLREELARSRWSGQAPWDALANLADELGLPELGDLADIMRLSGEEGAQVYATLRARSSAMRSAVLAADQTQANEISERLVIPGSMLGVLFLVIILGPALFRMFTSS